MKRLVSAVLATVLTAGILAGCGSKPADTYKKGAETPAPATPAPTVTLKIGQIPTVDGLPFWVAEAKDFYKKAGVNVELIKFNSANERDAAIIGGQIDGMLADPLATTTLYASGTKVNIASINLGVTKEEGPMGIMAAPGSTISKLEDLKNVEVATSTNSVTHYVLEKMLLDAGLKPEEIKITPIPQITLRFESLMSGKVKAAIMPDPLFSLAVSKGAKLLASDAQAKNNYSMSVVVFTEKAMKEKLDGVTKFFQAYNWAVGEIKAAPNSYRDVLVEKAGLPAEIKDAYQVVPFSAAQAPKKEDLEAVVQWLLDKKIIKSKVTYEELVNTSALPK